MGGISLFRPRASGRVSRLGRSTFESGPWYACCRTVGVVRCGYVKGVSWGIYPVGLQ
jgi:hypothetical protein